MSRIFKRRDGKILYESDGGTHRAAFKLDTSKGLSFDDQSTPIHITAAYRHTPTGWPPCEIGYDLREKWEQDIMKLKYPEGGDS